MHLKEIELENFKSFGRRINVPFLQGFTAITGPNGSGKSNITDAILFVLGPKSSKAIRADKLTDLIFNGGKSKNPAKFCKVTLIFDNTDRTIPIDSDEVRLTRHVRISKTVKDNYYSYFYVNGKNSSLNEFDNLLAHARISADGYNIVQQGDINRITQLSPTDRRKLLDDVAGITKFDKDITRAEDKRKQVDENLDRIGILVEEIKRQLGELDKDRKDALKYKELKEKLNVFKILMAIKRKENLELQIKTLEEHISSYEQKKIDMEEKTDETRQKIKETTGRLEEVEKKLAELAGDEAEELKKKIDEIKLNRFKAKDTEDNSKLDIEDYKREMAKVSNDLKTATKELKQYETQFSEIMEELKEKKDRKSDLAKELKELEDLASKSDDDILNMRREVTKLGHELETLRDKIHQGNLNKDRMSERLNRLELEITDAEEHIKKYEFSLQENAVLIKELDEGKSEEETKEGMEARLKKAIITEQKLIAQGKDLEDAIRNLTREHTQAKMQADAAALVQSGYNKAVQAILDARDTSKLQGIHGTIAELANVNEKYNDAMIVAAGGRMQSIVVDDDESAAKAIGYLKKNKIGRATFLPLNKMIVGKPSAKAHMAVQDEKSIGFAIDLVKFDAKYKPAFWYVFGDTIVSSDLASARKLMGGVRLVTLDGDLIESSGAMIGGMVPQKSLKFGVPTESEINKISKKLQEAIAHADKVAKEIQEVKTEILELESRLRKSSLEEKTISQKRKELELEAGQLNEKLNSSKDVFTKLCAESDRLKLEQENMVKTIEKLSADYTDLEGERDEKQDQMLKATSKEIADKIKALQEEHIELKEQVLSLESNRQTQETHIKIYKEQCEEYKRNLEEIEKKIQENKDRIEESKKRYRGYDEELNKLMKVEQAMTKDQLKLNEERDKLRERELKLRADLEKIDEKITSYNDLILSTGVQIQTINSDLAEAVNELQAYEYNEEDLEGEPRTLDELKRLIPDYERRMDSLQPVNLRAIDEFNAQNERLERLNEDVMQLEEQKENLNNLVDELMTKKKEGLMEVFNAVNENFKEIFGELSLGGTAEILLENPKEPFEGGLIIKARPKNKKALKLESLSGGEKSLTALALIFSILRYQPSPFYVLDEIDQNLDAINAENVGKMITRNSKLAQFIMVSLRKVTFKNASHVYGVTMQGTGLSYLIGKVNISEVGDEGEIMKDLKDLEDTGGPQPPGLPELTGG